MQGDLVWLHHMWGRVNYSVAAQKSTENQWLNQVLNILSRVLTCVFLFQHWLQHLETSMPLWKGYCKAGRCHKANNTPLLIKPVSIDLCILIIWATSTCRQEAAATAAAVCNDKVGLEQQLICLPLSWIMNRVAIQY